MAIEQARQQVEQAKRTITERRQELSQEQSRISEAEANLRQARQRLPDVGAQKVLRQANGIAGREQIRTIQSQSEAIAGRLGIVKGYKKDLTQAEKQISTYEKGVKGYESQVASVESHKAAFDQAKKAYESRQGVSAVDSSLARDYLKKFYRGEAVARQVYSDKINELLETQVSMTQPEIKLGTPTKFQDIAAVQASKLQSIQEQTKITQPTISVGSGDISNIISPKGERKSILGAVREFSGRQAELTSTESLLGGGGVLAISGKEVRPLKPNQLENIQIENIKKEYQGAVKEYNKATSDIKEFESGKDLKELSNAEIKEYNKLVGIQIESDNKAQRLSSELDVKEMKSARTFNIRNIGGKVIYSKQVPSSELTSIFGYGYQYTKTQIEAAGLNIGDIYGKTGVTISKVPFRDVGKLIKGEIKTKELFSNLVSTKPQAVLDLKTGTYRLPTEADVSLPKSSTLYVQPKDISRGATTALDIGSYAVPGYGGFRFGTGILESGSQVDFSPVRFVKEKPVEAITLGAVAVGLGGLKLKKVATKPIVVGTKESYRVTTKLDELFGKRVRISGDKATRELRYDTLPSERYLMKVDTKVAKTDPLLIGIQKGKIEEFRVIQEQPVVKKVTRYSKEGRELYKVDTRMKVELFQKQPKITSTFADLPIKIDTPYIARTAKKGKAGKLGDPKFELIVPSKPINIIAEDIPKLPSYQQHLAKETLKKGRRTDVPITKEDELLSLGQIRETSIKGKTKQYDIFAVSKEGVSFGEATSYDVIAGYKETTSALPRARGKIETLKGKIIKLPADETVDTGVQVLTSGGTKKTPFSATFMKELLKVKKLPKPKVKLPKPEAPKLSGKTIYEELNIISTPAKSAYAGTGLYERTEDIGAMATKTRPSIIQGAFEDTRVDVRLLSDIKPGYITEPKLDLEIKQEFVPKPAFKSLAKSMIDVKLDTRVTQKPKPALSAKQLLNQLLETRARQKPAGVITTKPKPTRTKIPIPKLGTPSKERIVEEARGVLDTFKVFVAKGGADIKVGEFGTLQEAKKGLREELTSTLRAGGVIKKGAKKVKVDLGYGFRPSKVDPSRVVQRKGFRFGTGGETREAQFFRKKSGGRKSIF